MKLKKKIRQKTKEKKIGNRDKKNQIDAKMEYTTLNLLPKAES